LHHLRAQKSGSSRVKNSSSDKAFCTDARTIAAVERKLQAIVAAGLPRHSAAAQSRLYAKLILSAISARPRKIGRQPSAALCRGRAILVNRQSTWSIDN
jgi:hypothetical protein